MPWDFEGVCPQRKKKEIHEYMMPLIVLVVLVVVAIKAIPLERQSEDR